MKKSIDYTKAITSGIITFEEACAIQGATMTQAIQEGILTFEQACMLQGTVEEVSREVTAKTAPKSAPKSAPTSKRKAAKKARSAKAKAEKKAQAESVKVMKNGAKYHTPQNHELTDYQVKRLDDAVMKMWEAGFENAEWRVEGKWAWIYAFSGEKGTGYTPAFKSAVAKAFKHSKWEYSEKRGAVVYKDFLR